MRILMLSWEYPPRIVGGIARVVHDLAQNLGKQGHEVHVVTCWEEGTVKEEKDLYVNVHRVEPYKINTNNFIDWILQLNFALLEGCIKLLNSGLEFSIIHLHDWVVAFAGKVLRNTYSIPQITTLHATEYGRNSGIHTQEQDYINSIEWRLGYETKKILANSLYMKNEIIKIFNIPVEKIKIIPNGIDLNKFDDIVRNYEFRRNYALDHERIIFFVGRLVNEKGVHILIDAIPKIIEGYHDVKFVIAGKGPEMERLKELAGYLGVYDNICFTGYISDDDLMRLYKCADIAVFPSLYEPFGIVVLEAMLAKIPVVASDTGGLKEIILHNHDGMKFSPGNSADLARCVLELLKNTELTTIITTNASKKLREVYNWDVITLKVIESYREVIGKDRSLV